MSSKDETEWRLSEVGKRANDSPGRGKKKPKTKASDTIPAGSGTHLNLEAKSLIFAVFEKFKSGEVKIDSRICKKERGKKKSVEQTAYTMEISATTVKRVKTEGNKGKFVAPVERGGVPFENLDVAGFEKIRAVRTTLLEDFINVMQPPSAEKICAKIKEKQMCDENGTLINLSPKQTRRILSIWASRGGGDMWNGSSCRIIRYI